MTILTSEIVTEINDDTKTIGFKVGARWKGNTTLVKLFNLPYIAGFKIISSKELMIWSASGGRFSRIKDASVNHVNINVRSASAIIIELIRRTDGELDLRKSSHLSMISILVSANILSSGDNDSLRTLASSQISRAQELWEQNITINDIRGAKYAT